MSNSENHDSNKPHQEANEAALNNGDNGSERSDQANSRCSDQKMASDSEMVGNGGGGVSLNIGENVVKKATGKGMRQEGQRNLQDSTFSISRELDGGERRSCIRVCNPPGGQSSGGFW